MLEKSKKIILLITSQLILWVLGLLSCILLALVMGIIAWIWGNEFTGNILRDFIFAKPGPFYATVISSLIGSMFLGAGIAFVSNKIAKSNYGIRYIVFMIYLIADSIIIIMRTYQVPDTWLFCVLRISFVIGLVSNAYLCIKDDKEKRNEVINR